MTVRTGIVAAILTILRAYHVAGRPKHTHPPMGSFEGWDALIRGAHNMLQIALARNDQT